jgi:hypothetical protein
MGAALGAFGIFHGFGVDIDILVDTHKEHHDAHTVVEARLV